MNLVEEVDALWKVLLAGMLGGVGLVTLYAFGLLMVSGRVTENGGTFARVMGRAVGGACFTVVLVGAGVGLYVILAK
ncbi:hypothetical protein Pth03_35900 [Planotetraspora thailandica]|uniref:Uncharacterized protein n=1 Tax=Planotetraspora thailandica TaxID=487172 RepID=A0A8J3V576_9ACTN|nr:hypothetical protein [Planotetraspora thailandica]GII55201.1 hypothetical protein Pth03_35900 [Planotetraspora thailandica]